MVSPLAEFLSTTSSATAQLEPGTFPPIAQFTRELRQAQESLSVLAIDGVDVEADSIDARGSFALRARVGQMTVILCGDSTIRDELSAGLTWHRPAHG